jgi:WD40 repeat protein/transcriptional regulator with XRE-family HTH domain
MGRKDKNVTVADSGKTPHQGILLRLSRQQGNITLTRMAERIGYTKSHLSSVENGFVRPSPGLIEKYEQELGLERGEMGRLYHEMIVSSGNQMPYSAPVKKLIDPQLPSENEVQPALSLHTSLKDYPVLGPFYGRTQELADLQLRLMEEQCQLIAIFGIGGIGKTTLAARFADEIKNQFEFFFWRSLQNAPTIKQIVESCIQFVSEQPSINIPPEIDEQVELLIEFLQNHRCLIVLDNLESILQSGTHSGLYRKGYEGYGKLIKRLGQVLHKSCLLLTSREKPAEFTMLEGKTPSVFALQLSGIRLKPSLQLLHESGLHGDEEKLIDLVQLYAGNPFTLKLIANYIQTAFGGNIDAFLKTNESIFSDIQELLDQQFSRLAEREQEVMYWLGIEREAVTLEDLLHDLIHGATRLELLDTLHSLISRSFVEITGDNRAHYRLQQVILDYVTERFLQQAYAEIETESIQFLNTYALMKAQTKDSIRETQKRFILDPLLERLSRRYVKETIEDKLKGTLSRLQSQRIQQPGYIAGNILNLLIALHVDPSGYDFSKLIVQQGYLQGATLKGINFRQTDFKQTIFTDTFGSILSIALSPDQSQLAAGTANGVIRLWNAESGTPELTCQGHKGWIWSIAFSHDSRLLASGSGDKNARIWDARNGTAMKVLQGHEDWVRAVTFNPDSTLLASGSEDHTIRIWDVETAQCRNTLAEHTSWIRTLMFSPDGSLLASGSEDQTIRLWDVATGQCLKVLRNHHNRIRSLAFNSDGTLLASGGEDHEVLVWDVATGTCLKMLGPLPDRTCSVAFSPDNQYIATGGGDKIIRIWEVETGKIVKSLSGHTHWIRAVAFTANGKRLVSGSEDQTIRIWDIERVECIRLLEGYSNWMWAIAYSPDGKSLVSGGEDKLVSLWDVQSHKSVKSLPGHDNRVWSVAFSPDGQTIASGSEDQTIRLWNTRNGICFKTLYGHTDRVRSVVFSPVNKNILLSVSEDQTLRIWDISTGDSKALHGHKRIIWAAALSTDGTTAATGSSDGTAKLWNISTGENMRTLEGHTDVVRSIAFSPNGSIVASGSDDQTIKLWDVATGKHLRTLKGHSSLVYAVAFSPNGQYIASGSQDQTIKIWEVKTGRLVSTLVGHTRLVWSLAFSPDGASLASCSEDGSIRIWDVLKYTCSAEMYSEGPYWGMDISGATGLTPVQKAALKDLGAIEDEES